MIIAPSRPGSGPIARFRALLREGPAPLLALFALGSAGLFGILASDVLRGERQGWDEAILLALRRPDAERSLIGPPWLHEAARDITGLGSTPVLVLAVLVASGYFLVIRQRSAALLLLVSVAGGALLGTLMKMGFDRARPDLVPHAAKVFTASFPSGHAMLSAITFLTLGALVARAHAHAGLRLYLTAVALAMTVLVGVSRVYIGVHWPSDVLAGWSIGSAWSIVCWYAMAYIGRRLKPSGAAGN
ncbi:phosphatase PAP2 family protein [Chelatococcus sp. SYSU_G07232]|uniref:Phosphatase PAP2 family protein n=1 Tax=Chelatococcus albus TaxID=3047466 RepID=A0ABT7AFE6_9HYPH|nr:phosphatase PAP2 family protein [Chelatococcus sp. SYSU_G07232]MDJ1157569.1 phosphatase PAP2 family protein [Chelatococcus sp. SYSU_G07232]